MTHHAEKIAQRAKRSSMVSLFFSFVSALSIAIVMNVYHVVWWLHLFVIFSYIATLVLTYLAGCIYGIYRTMTAAMQADLEHHLEAMMREND